MVIPALLQLGGADGSSVSAAGVALFLIALYLIGKAIPQSDRRIMSEAFDGFRQRTEREPDGDEGGERSGRLR